MIRSKWYLTIALVLGIGLLVVAISSGVLYWQADDGGKSDMRSELFKYLVQLGVIVIVGGAVAILYKEIERAGDESREHFRLRQEFVDRLGEIYRSVKESRRLLRAAGLTRAYGQQPSVLTEFQNQAYDTHMLLLNRAQLNLEALGIESKRFLPGVNTKRLWVCLDEMGDYLKNVVREYEEMRPYAVHNFEQMPALDEFTLISPRTTGDNIPTGTFYGSFVIPHKKAIRAISKA